MHMYIYIYLCIYKHIYSYIGGIELKYPHSEIDDETLYSIINTLKEPLPRLNINENNNGINDNNDNDNKSLSHTIHHSNNTSQSTTDNRNSDNSNLENRNSDNPNVDNRIKDNLYINLIILLNLKDNRLTDMSCKLIGTLIEMSSSLRMVDLRDNFISNIGVKVLMTATEENSTIFSAIQRKAKPPSAGERTKDIDTVLMIMIEGYREKSPDIHVSGFTGDMQKPKHPLRIDLRGNQLCMNFAVVILSLS
jgi:hypothetical protein